MFWGGNFFCWVSLRQITSDVTKLKQDNTNWPQIGIRGHVKQYHSHKHSVLTTLKGLTCIFKFKTSKCMYHQTFSCKSVIIRWVLHYRLENSVSFIGRFIILPHRMIWGQTRITIDTHWYDIRNNIHVCCCYRYSFVQGVFSLMYRLVYVTIQRTPHVLLTACDRITLNRGDNSNRGDNTNRDPWYVLLLLHHSVYLYTII